MHILRLYMEYRHQKKNAIIKKRLRYLTELNEMIKVAGSSKSFPPLTMNALMEYKALIKAPGTGEFENGRPKLFKLT